jgi:hypothetical protein
MRKLTTLAVLALALAAFGCASQQMTYKGQPVTAETKLTCPKCGASFTIDEGLEAFTGGP